MAFITHFAGHIKKHTQRNVGESTVIECSLCEKNYQKEGEEVKFTWINVSIWISKGKWIPDLAKGSFIAGFGRMSMRSYMKDQEKVNVIEVRCDGMNITTPKVYGSAVAEGPDAQLPKGLPTGTIPVKLKPAPVEDDPNLPPF